MLLHIYLLSFVLQFTMSTVNRGLKITSGLEEVSRGSVAMRFYIQLDNTGEDCVVECVLDRCCLEQGEEEDCDTLQMFGGCLQNVPSGESRTVRLAAPLLSPFERRGYCVVHLHSKAGGDEAPAIYRDTVTIPFDTGTNSDVTPCVSIDQDPLNNCLPVDCNTYYNGRKPHFSKRLKRCVKTPLCKEDSIYDARTNKCVGRITGKDIRRIKSMIRRRKDLSEARTKAKQETEMLSDMKTLNIDTRSILPMTLLNWNSVEILSLVILAQCCVVVVLIYFIIKRKCFKKEKELMDKFFNSKQESVTTPLLSNNCTVTTCQFHSESSSDVDRKIRCYKACQKDKTKTSMSDDILSRCLKRRDWTRKPKSSEVIPESKETKFVQDIMNKIIDKWANRSAAGSIDTDVPKSLPDQTSEKELKCLDYEEKRVFCNDNLPSSTGKAAQAYFPKDSIDDLLSERGIISSKYAFASESRSLNVSEGSSKNIRNFLSRYRKSGPSSDPGCDLELLHMSRASMFSSSASVHTALKRFYESRSSL